MPISPPTIAAEDVLEIQVMGKASGQVMMNRYHYVNTGTALPPSSQLEKLLADFVAEYRLSFLPLLCDTYTVAQYNALAITGWKLGADPTKYSPFVVAKVTQPGDALLDKGSINTDPLPTFAAVTGRKITVIPSRRYMGSNRYGPIAEADTVNNKLIEAKVTAWRLAYSTIMNNVLTDDIGGSPQVWSPAVFSLLSLKEGEDAGAVNVAGKYAREVWKTTVSDTIGSQLSRKERRSAL
jgi:hypothetical protein